MVEADAVRQAHVVARCILGLYELPIRELQESLAAAELRAGLELQQLVATLVIEERRGYVTVLAASVGQLTEPFGGEARGNAPGGAERKAHREADGVDAADLRVAVLQRHDVEVTVDPEIRRIELQLIV